MSRGLSLLLAVLVLLMPAVSSAQARSPSWFAGGLGGVTFGDEQGAVVAGQIGRRVVSNVVLIGEVGRAQNLMTTDVRARLDRAIDDLASQVGIMLDADVKVPATYGLFGGRWTPRAGKTGPFVESGIGAAHLSATIVRAEVMGIDVKALVQSQLPATTSVTDLLVVFGGGVTVRMTGTTWLDIGYRYSHIATARPDVNFSLVYGAMKFGR